MYKLNVKNKNIKSLMFLFLFLFLFLWQNLNGMYKGEDFMTRSILLERLYIGKQVNSLINKETCIIKL